MSRKKKKISRMILNYLQKNPESGDTLEGIMRWWLEMERIELSVDDVGDVMKSLIKKGKISMYKTKGGTIFYKIKRDPN